MRRSPIKVNLKRVRRVEGLNTKVDEYHITSISGAITLGTYAGQVLRVGDAIDEKMAERLTLSYLVTVNRQ